MIRTKTKIEITVERRQRITLRRRVRQVAWCQTCDAMCGIISLEGAGLLSKATLREIYRLLEKGELHFVVTCEGEFCICGNSFEHLET